MFSGRFRAGMIGIKKLVPVPYSYSGEGPGGYWASHGNCSAPNECTCWCKAGYNELICNHKSSLLDQVAWALARATAMEGGTPCATPWGMVRLLASSHGAALR